MPNDKVLENIARGEAIMREKVEDYKKAHPEMLPDLNFALLMKSLNRVNESSPVKIARNAFNENREWIPGTETWNVGKVYLSDDHYVTFTISRGDKVMTAEMLLEALHDINKKLPLKDVPIAIEINDETRVVATDLYAHSLVTSMWAGLPVDFVLCYSQKVEKKQASTPTAD